MSIRGRAWSDYQIDRMIGTLLRLGVIVSALVVSAGGVVYLLHHGAALPNYRVFHGEPSDLCTIRGIIADAFSFHGRSIIQLGLVLLIATPVFRVAFAVLAFALQKDRTYVVVTCLVLLLLLFSITGGGR